MQCKDDVLACCELHTAANAYRNLLQKRQFCTKKKQLWNLKSFLGNATEEDILTVVWCHIGSGKTRIAVELAGLLLQKKPAAKVVFLATTVALAQQQAGQLLLCCSVGV